MGRQGTLSTIKMFLLLVPLAFLGCVSGHGGVLWPPTWQAGVATPISKLKNEWVFTEPKARDPNTGREVYKAKSWLTAQAYTGGIGEEFKGIGPKTNINNKNLKEKDRCVKRCNWQRNPWAAPGQAPVVGVGWCWLVLVGVGWCWLVWCGVVWCGVVWCGVV